MVFNSDRTKALQFRAQWNLYQGVNSTSDIMRNYYRRSLLFLGYIQGDLVNEWVMYMTDWLMRQTETGFPEHTRCLWEETLRAFNRRFPILHSFRRISYLCHPSCQQSIAIGDASAPSPSIPLPARMSSSSPPSPHQMRQQHRLTTTELAQPRQQVSWAPPFICVSLPSFTLTPIHVSASTCRPQPGPRQRVSDSQGPAVILAWVHQFPRVVTVDVLYA
ncbi:hypothetical protein EDB85DRAFT_2235681 [Lactarius pseudohatsudake]|nr:hypothetical protein EDB85DRAFT_2235681 [Lactarius pseudohatsudake]